MKRPLWLAAAILFVAGIQTSSAYELTGRVVSVADGAHAPGFGSVFHFCCRLPDSAQIWRR